MNSPTPRRKRRRKAQPPIEAKKAQILLDAYEPAYREALQKRVELEKEQADLKNRIAEQEKKTQAAHEKFMEVYNSQGADAAYEYANAYIAEQNALNSLKDSYTEADTVCQ